MISEGSNPEMVTKGEIAWFFTRGLLAKSDKSPGSVNKPDTRPIRYRTIDYDVTGSISMREPGVTGQKMPDSVIDGISTPVNANAYNTYVLRFVHGETVLLQSNRDFFVVRRGTMLPGVGKVLSIERRGKRWILVTPTRTFTQVINDAS
jgi:hypothetical protein